MDWAAVKFFQAQNAALMAGPDRVEVVFMGDSLTQFWSDERSDFFRPNWINRGLSGQTTPQMLVRFRQDVIDLKPRVVHIMAGTNDVAGNTGPMTLAETLGNLRTMSELARLHELRVVLASVPPSHGHLIELSALIKAYANEAQLVHADYHAALDNGIGALSAQHTNDGLHLTRAGYDVISDVANGAISKALNQSGRPD